MFTVTNLKKKTWFWLSISKRLSMIIKAKLTIFISSTGNSVGVKIVYSDFWPLLQNIQPLLVSLTRKHWGGGRRLLRRKLDPEFVEKSDPQDVGSVSNISLVKEDVSPRSWSADETIAGILRVQIDIRLTKQTSEMSASFKR